MVHVFLLLAGLSIFSETALRDAATKTAAPQRERMYAEFEKEISARPAEAPSFGAVSKGWLRIYRHSPTKERVREKSMHAYAARG